MESNQNLKSARSRKHRKKKPDYKIPMKQNTINLPDFQMPIRNSTAPHPERLREVSRHPMS